MTMVCVAVNLHPSTEPFCIKKQRRQCDQSSLRHLHLKGMHLLTFNPNMTVYYLRCIRQKTLIQSSFWLIWIKIEESVVSSSGTGRRRWGSSVNSEYVGSDGHRAGRTSKKGTWFTPFTVTESFSDFLFAVLVVGRFKFTRHCSKMTSIRLVAGVYFPCCASTAANMRWKQSCTF